MRHEIEAETTTAEFLLLDPVMMPAALGGQPVHILGDDLERLVGNGSVCRVGVGRDGSYRIHVYVDEPIPERLRDRARPAERIESFPIPTGRFSVVDRVDALLGAVSPEAQARIENQSMLVPPGAYRLTLSLIDDPERPVHESFRAQAPWPEYLAWISMKGLIPLAVAAWIGLVVIFFTTVRVPFPDLAGPLFALLFVLPFVVRRLDTFAAARARFAALQREFPDIVVMLDLPRPLENRDVLATTGRPTAIAANEQPGPSAHASVLRGSREPGRLTSGSPRNGRASPARDRARG